MRKPLKRARYTSVDPLTEADPEMKGLCARWGSLVAILTEPRPGVAPAITLDELVALTKNSAHPQAAYKQFRHALRACAQTHLSGSRWRTPA